MQMTRFTVLLGAVAVAVSCGGEPEAPPVEITPGLQAFVGARIIDGTGASAIENGVLVVRDGRIEAVGSSDTIAVPERRHFTGRYVDILVTVIRDQKTEPVTVRLDPTSYEIQVMSQTVLLSAVSNELAVTDHGSETRFEGPLVLLTLKAQLTSQRY